MRPRTRFQTPEDRRRRSYVNALKMGILKSARADLVNKYKLAGLVKELKVPIRRVEGVEVDFEAADAPAIRRPPIPENLQRFPKQVRYRWLRLQRSFDYWSVQRNGKPTARQLAFFQRYDLVDIAREAGFVISDASQAITLDQFRTPMQA